MTATVLGTSAAEFEEETFRTQRLLGRSPAEARRIAVRVVEELLEAATLPVLPCPSWCTLPAGHSWTGDVVATGDDGQNVYERQHYGPRFGPFCTQGDEQSDAPGKVHQLIYLGTGDKGDLEALDDIDDAEVLRTLAQHALEAAAWLEGN